MLRKFLAFIILILVFLSSPQQSHASEYFSREYAVVYSVKESGITEVSITVTLMNKTSDYYASSDTITVGFENITNVSARDPDGAINPKVTKTDAGNAIDIPFNKRVVGNGKALVFTLTFDTPDVARKQGKIWEINIPGIANPDEFSAFTTEVKVPESFGKPSYIKPAQGNSDMKFSKEQLGESGISIAYGSEQLYTFSLVYHLRNKNVFPVRTEIALPPNTNYQEVAIDAITPQPNNVTIDKDGNWLAEYTLTPSQQVDVTVRGKVKVLNTPRQEVLSADQFAVYTRERPYWQTSSAEIKKLARQYRTPKAIYQYVVDTLQYDFNRVAENKPRLGAAAALQSKDSAVCLEFTDLFIAIARAAGIPAREVNGYAHTENTRQRPLSLVQDILHAWPEYYDLDKQTWVMVDPTWGNTTGGTDYFHVFDFDHITFVRKGLSSEYPIPAGGYKYAGDEGKKDIFVGLATTFPSTPAKLELQPIFPYQNLSGLAVNGKVLAKNVSPVLALPQVIIVSTDNLRPQRKAYSLTAIPPYGSAELPVSFAKTPLLTNNTYNFTISLGDTIIRQKITITPFAFSTIQILGGLSVIILTIIILIVTIKTRRVSLPQQK